MQAFKGDKKLKKLLLDEIIRHRKADLLRQGAYKTEIDGKFRFCAVGCAIETMNVKLGKDYSNGDHGAYEKELEIPRQLAYLEDRIFENLPKEKAMMWPEQFIAAIPVGANLTMVMPKLMLWIMDDVKKFAKKSPEVLKVIATVRELYRKKIKGEIIKNEEWISARDAAYAAAYAAYDAAYAAYAAADAAYAAYAAAYAAYAATDAAYAAADAAYAATDAAYAATDAAYAAARKQQWIRTSKQLIFLLESSKKAAKKKK